MKKSEKWEMKKEGEEAARNKRKKQTRRKEREEERKIGLKNCGREVSIYRVDMHTPFP